MDRQAFHRAELQLGPRVMARLAQTRVLLMGVGGVGSWAAEALVRSGVGQLTIVDSDRVDVTNVNRQLQATPATVGVPKVEALKERLLSINPRLKLTAMHRSFNRDIRDEFHLETYDYVLDAIDSITCKVDLIQHALEVGVKLFATMGAARKLDPTKLCVRSIWQTEGCPLARLVRKKLRQRGVRGDFLCVYSEELHAGHNVSSACAPDNGDCPEHRQEVGRQEAVDTGYRTKRHINGSLVHVTGTVGFVLAGLVIQDLVDRSEHCGAARTDIRKSKEAS